MAAGALGVAVAGAAGFAVQHLGGANLDPVAGAVVAVTSDLAGGRTLSGTGMLIRASGEVLTTDHVVDTALRITVAVPGGRTPYTAAIFGLDPTDDIGLLQLQGVAGLPIVPIGDSSAIATGAHVTVVGAASGGAPLEAQGSVTGLGQSVTLTDPDSSTVRSLAATIAFDAAAPAGDAGAPVVDSSGRVIGLDVSAGARVFPPTDGGFAVPIDTALTVVRAMETGAPNPNVLRGYAAALGVGVVDSVNPPGAVVTGVIAASPAQAAGIETGDVIVSLDGAVVTSAAALAAMIQRRTPGDRVMVGWISPGGQRRTAVVILAAGIES